MNGIDKAVKEAGSQTKLAKSLGVVQQAVSRWQTAGFVPFTRAMQIHRAYGIPLIELIDPHIVLVVKHGLDCK